MIKIFLHFNNDNLKGKVHENAMPVQENPTGLDIESFHEIDSSHVQRSGVFSTVGSCVTSAAFLSASPLCMDWLLVPPLLTRFHAAQPEQRDSQSCPRARSAPSAHQIKMEALGVQVQRPCAFPCSRL